jgi:hypothetical protein
MLLKSSDILFIFEVSTAIVPKLTIAVCILVSTAPEVIHRR